MPKLTILMVSMLLSICCVCNVCRSNGNAPPFTPTPLLPTATPTPIPPTSTPTQSEISNMILIPSGVFTMGHGKTLPSDTIEHAVYLDDYYIDKYEVTNALYGQCVEAEVCSAPTHCLWGNTVSYNDSRFVNHPVVCLDWEMARTYCEWRGARLPTEAEWEKAARGTDGRSYPWGSKFDIITTNICKLANVYDCVGRTKEVGSYPNGASPYGVLDMHGNAWEWVADYYDEAYYEKSPRENPLNNSPSDFRVLRGLSWDEENRYSSVSGRHRDTPTNSKYDYGVRCVR